MHKKTIKYTILFLLIVMGMSPVATLNLFANSDNNTMLDQKDYDAFDKLDQQGYEAFEKGNYDQALEYYKKLLDIQLAKLGSRNQYPEISSTYSWIAGTYVMKKDFDQALEYSMKSLDIELKNLGPRHPQIASIYFWIAEIYEEKGDYQTALVYLNQSLKIRKDQFGDEHNRTKETLAKIKTIKEKMD